MNWKTIHNVYFIGIGGIGMSALARYCLAHSLSVAGYDRTETPLTRALVSAGCFIHYQEDVDQIPSNFHPARTLVVVTPAVPDTHAEWRYFKDKGFKILKRAELLARITQDTRCLVVAGTHGKTTTSAVIGYLLDRAGAGATTLLGGIAEDYQSNLIFNEGSLTVVEADEYDRSFLALHPTFACITSMDADHLDCYEDLTDLQSAFNSFAAKLRPDSLLVRQGLPLEGLTYAVECTADYQARHLRIEDGKYRFDFKTPSRTVPGWTSPLPGLYNLENVLAALALIDICGVDVSGLQPFLRRFKGVQRRFSIHYDDRKRVYVDDYAHHPEAIRLLIRALRERYPGKRITGVFQPHLYSRTRDFMDDFAYVLSQLDRLLLLDIYPAREQPIPGVTAAQLLDKVRLEDKQLVARQDLLETIKNTDFQLLLTMGAGDIDTFVEPITALLRDEA